jgi:hypothetical protein
MRMSSLEKPELVRLREPGRVAGNFEVPDAFSGRAIDLFQHGLFQLLIDDLGRSPSFAEEFARIAARELSSHRENAFPPLAERLAASGVRESWNRVLRDERSAALGRWVATHTTGTVLDLLCGDGRVGEWLWRQGFPVTLCEREAAYPEVDRQTHQPSFVSYERLNMLLSADTVLVATVLHHEPEPEPLLRLASALGRVRLVIVENCIEEETPEDYHLLMDLFFNRCLNEFDVPAIPRHRTVASWRASASRFGKPLLCDRLDRLPGIPLPHHLIVIDLHLDGSESETR